MTDFSTTDFQAALIHELKNHLGLLGMTLERVPMTGDAAHDMPLDDARLLCQSVTDRLRQALWLYKANLGPLTPDIDAYSPHDLINALAARAKTLSRNRFVVETRLADSLPPVAFFDRDLIEMAMTNAIQNSLAYARSRIVIEGERRDDYLILAVRDDSDGYPQHVLESVAAGTPYRARGTGLGLQFSRLIAQLHENQGRPGELHLANAHGAVFQLLLP
ncbi:MAG: ATP-binding protein [Pseudomonadota bacterium]